MRCNAAFSESPLLHAPYRSECSNCEVGEQCGVLMHGRAATFCEPFGERELVTAPRPTALLCTSQHTHCTNRKHRYNKLQWGGCDRPQRRISCLNMPHHSVWIGPPSRSFSLAHTNTAGWCVRLSCSWLVTLIATIQHISHLSLVYVLKSWTRSPESGTFSPLFTANCCKALSLELHTLFFHDAMNCTKPRYCNKNWS